VTDSRSLSELRKKYGETYGTPEREAENARIVEQARRDLRKKLFNALLASELIQVSPDVWVNPSLSEVERIVDVVSKFVWCAEDSNND
jgi:hypothetical protein